ncbi:MAG TPA: hypothetical protein VF607_17560, partial [Verrucomicrobiae bacterium]
MYKVYYGTNSGSYDKIDVTYINNGDYIYGLEDGQTYYFAVAAVDYAGNVSPLSQEVSYTVSRPTAPVLQTEMVYDRYG